ncbi:unnamed protein product [Amoebophrya sp. A120]|nr:unnamed protein product [Amoebophrya sp. A120]|eukprot:GSA120T00017578001.1
MYTNIMLIRASRSQTPKNDDDGPGGPSDSVHWTPDHLRKGNMQGAFVLISVGLSITNNKTQLQYRKCFSWCSA